MRDPGQSCNVVFSSEIADWSEVNSSFDKGVLRIAYHGENKNKTFISKEAFDDAIKSVFNCPVVCNYNRKTDSIGAHDVDVVRRNGETRMVNVTTPVGVVPESADVWWTDVTEADGTVHEYLCTDILIWKRQEAYEHIKENGITDESMEIRILSGAREDDELYHINKFEFLAFCLLESAPPCFESASIEMFALNEFKEQYTRMMEDVKREFSVNTASADDIHTQSCSKGGTCELSVSELMTKYSLSAEDVTFDTTNMPLEEIERRFSEIKNAKARTANFDDGEAEETDPSSGTDPEADPSAEPGSEEPGEEPTEDPEGEDQEDDDDKPARKQGEYSLSANQLWDELREAVYEEKYLDPYWGECTRYSLVDYDAELGEVYVIDNAEDYHLYGMPFSMNGDKVVIDFNARKRKKMSFVDFDEGEEAFAASRTFAGLIPEVQEKFKDMNGELEALREFKAQIDEQARKAKVEEVFSSFADLESNADFRALRENYGDMTENQIEEKCFAIRGRSMPVNFSLDNPTKPIRLPIESQANKDAEEPYGGIFTKYGIGNR